MAKTDDKVMAVVEKELEKDPDASVQDLYDKAKSVKSAIGKLTLRQFNARYPLQVKRKKSARARSRYRHVDHNLGRPRFSEMVPGPDPGVGGSESYRPGPTTGVTMRRVSVQRSKS